MKWGSDLSKVSFHFVFFLRGSFGTVRRCTRLSDNLGAAVKIIRKRDLTKRELHTLDREANILSQVKHAHCVELYGILLPIFNLSLRPAELTVSKKKQNT